MARETQAERIRREQVELMARLNAERDARMTTRQQNDMKMRGAPAAPARAAAPQGNAPRTVPLGGAAGRAQSALANRGRQVDAAVNKATGKAPKY